MLLIFPLRLLFAIYFLLFFSEVMLMYNVVDSSWKLRLCYFWLRGLSLIAVGIFFFWGGIYCDLLFGGILECLRRWMLLQHSGELRAFFWHEPIKDKDRHFLGECIKLSGGFLNEGLMVALGAVFKDFLRTRRLHFG